MPIRTNTNPRPLALPPELQDVLHRNGMTAQVVGSSNGFALIVQGHDSPVLTYQINERQLKALTDWGTNTANRKAYNTFASIVAADFDMPKDFIHARNANGRVAMGLHGYRIGVGEYGRRVPTYGYHGHNPFRYPHHMMGWGFLGWTPRMQEGWHMRRIGGQLFYPGAPMVPTRPDGRMKPGELANGGYGFYYKGHTTAPVAAQPQDVLANLQTVIRPNLPERPQGLAIPYNQAITSDVYFSNEKWLEILKSHGIVVDTQTNKLTIQSASLPADLQYDLKPEEVAALTSNSLAEHSIDARLAIINGVIKEDFADPITKDMLNSDKLIDIKLHPEVEQELNQQLTAQNNFYDQQVVNDPSLAVAPEVSPLGHELQEGAVLMHGEDLNYIDPDKGWFREGRHGREVYVEDIRVEPYKNEQGETQYRMSAVIDGKVISHDIKEKDYNKFMAVDDFHRMKLFSKIFKEVDMKDRYPVDLGTKIAAALGAGLVVGGIVHGVTHRPGPDFYMEGHPGPRVYHKPSVDTPADVAARQFDVLMNDPGRPHGPAHGLGF